MCTDCCGQGANQGLEDAFTLGEMLGAEDAMACPSDALRKWEASRIDRTSIVQLGSHLQGAASYGDAKLAEVEAALPAEVLAKFKAEYGSRQALEEFLLSVQLKPKA
jgi:2-polyprenyl-6-methoxyphenol hydroxylase-like FAD-dependent oxidoreductase